MMNATVVRRIDVTKDLLIIHVKPDAGVPDFIPGQYVALALADDKDPAPTDSKKIKLIKRAYSIGSPPHVKDYLEFYIAIVPTGELTPKVAELGEGDRIFVTPKITGTFTLKNAPSDKDLVFISTGTGIAPYMAMLRCPNTWTPGRKIIMIHGVRYASDLAYAEELREYVKEGRPIEYYQIVSRADASWEGHKGRIQKLFLDGIVQLDSSRQHIFLCGNPDMIAEMENLLKEKGFIEHTKKVPGNLHLEKYW